MSQQYWNRTREQVAGLFADMDLVPPGLVLVEEWRTRPAAAGAGTSTLWSGVARKA